MKTLTCSCATRRRLLFAALALPLGGVLAACQRAETASQDAAPVEIGRGTSCALDGMLLADYPGPKAQIHYRGTAEPEFHCDTVEMFSQLLAGEQIRPVRAVYVQDMGKADWQDPVGHWIDARTAFYVAGSRKHGAMGPTFASFAVEADAQAFAKHEGGQVHPFAKITPEMADLSGGTRHDHSM